MANTTQHDSPRAQLRLLADEIEEFLLRQVERLERGFTLVESAQQEIDEEAALAKFKHERDLWDQRRQEEADRLEHEGALLREAWQRLELEQKRLLADQELARRTTAIGTPPPAARSTPAAEPIATGLASTSAGQSGDEEEHSTWLQFQQMRRAMQTHSRDGKKS